MYADKTLLISCDTGPINTVGSGTSLAVESSKLRFPGQSRSVTSCQLMLNE